MLEIASKAILLTLFLRWISPIDLPFRWVFVIGVIGLLVDHGTISTAASASPIPMPDLFLITGVVLAFVGVVQILRSPY